MMAGKVKRYEKCAIFSFGEELLRGKCIVYFEHKFARVMSDDGIELALVSINGLSIVKL